MKSFVFCLLSFVLAFVATAQAPQQRPNQFNRGLNRNRPGRQAPQAVQPPQAAQSSEAADSAEASAFNWDAAPVDIVLQAYGERVKKTILKDPQVPAATITLKSREGQKLTDEEYLEAIETILEMNQIHLEPYGESFIRALPRKDVRKEGIPLIMDPERQLKESGKVVSMMINFKYIATEEAQKALEGLKSNSGILLVFERTNSILVTDTEQNINRMLEIAKMIDKESPVTEVVEYIQIKYANANEVKQVIDSIVQESMKEQEKNGKTPKNAAQTQNNGMTRPFLNGIRRPGQQNQPQTPTSQESLVMTVSDADRGMIRGKVVTIADERSNKILIITNQSNMKFFKDVIAALDVETTPDTVVKVYRLKYAEAEDVSDMINDLIGNSSSSKSSGKANQNQNARQGTSGSVTRNTQQAAKKPANQRTGDVKAGELNKENTTVLADKRINGIVVMTNKELVPTIEQIIESMDIKLAQVLIETVIIEVSLGDELSTGMDWIQKGRAEVQSPINGGVTGYDGDGDPIYDQLHYAQRKTTITKADGSTEESTSYLSKLVPSDWAGSSSTTTYDDGSTKTVVDTVSSMIGTTAQISHDGIANYWTAGTATALGGGQGGQIASEVAAGITSNLLGKAFNFIFDSDELGIAGILQLTKSDSHSKYVASPIIMTLDNKEAIIEATSTKQFLTGWTAQSSGYYGGGMPAPNYTAKEIGIKVKATPKINPNGTVMLEVEEEYSQIGGQQQMMTPNASTYVEKPVDIPATRKMSSDVILENGQTVVFGGLTQTFTMESEKGIPFLKDIPYIGKWLFGTVEQSEDRTELLVFMTPYVLDDAQAAQAEALRRKKTMSDPKAWEDHGWSLSELADPVSQKEQMRRLKDEWKKQDAERQAKIEIEKGKLERAKKLEAMSKEERDLWLKMHKEELEKEQQEELEKKMLDKDSQEELKKLAEKIRADKLDEAGKVIKKAESEAAALNERTRLDAEKKAEKEAKGQGEVEEKSAAGLGKNAEPEKEPAEAKDKGGAR